MVNNGRGREEDRGEPSAVAPEENRALGRYVAIWTTNPEEKQEDRPHNRRQVEETHVIYLFIYLFLINACNLKVMARFTELNT
jgi:hypothetical protein